MPFIVKNEKGLFASPARFLVNCDNYEKLRAAVAENTEATAWLGRFEAMCEKQRQWGWGREKQHVLVLSNALGGFGNETFQWEMPLSTIRSWWDKLAELQSSRAAAFAGFKPEKDSGPDMAMGDIEKALPKKATVERIKTLVFEELEDGWEAKGGEAWAIWMGSPRELGYMDDKKRPAGAASARLFESAAAANRTAKAAKFGGDRGAAAIVRLQVECVKIESSDPGSPCLAVRSHMARREAIEIKESLEAASIDDIRRALGEPVGEGAAPAEPPPEGSLAGREEGYACWVDRHGDKGGFVNIRGDLGPLTGSVLKASVKGADQKGWSGQSSIVKVACWPVAIDALIGEPITASLTSAIAWEQEQAAGEALRKQSSETLKARAAALESGEVAPRRRARSL